MKENLKLWAFIVLLPFFAALAHDVYFNFLSNEEQKTKLEAFEIDPNAYQTSDMGYILLKYVPDEYYYLRNEVVGEEKWETWVDPVLQLYTYVVALIPAFLFFAWVAISRIIDSAAPTHGLKNKDSYKREKGVEFKYKRRG